MKKLKLRKAIQLATVLNLLIIFMGLFGIVAFTPAKRTREIVVRKVRGTDGKIITFFTFLFITAQC